MMSRTDSGHISIHMLTIDKPCGRSFFVPTITPNVLINSNRSTNSSSKADIGRISLSCCFSSRCSLFSNPYAPILFVRGGWMILNCHIGLRVMKSVCVQRQGCTNNLDQIINMRIDNTWFFHRFDKRLSAGETMDLFLGLMCMSGIDSLGECSALMAKSGLIPKCIYASPLFHKPVRSLPTLMASLRDRDPSSWV